MNAQRFVTLTLIFTLPLVWVTLAIGGGVIQEPFSVYMKRAELIFIGTLTDKQHFHNEVTNGFVTDLTFDIDKLILGNPKNKDTITFCIPGGEGIHPKTGEHVEHRTSMGQEHAHLEVGDQVIMFLEFNSHIAKWMPRHGGLHPLSGNHGCWFIKTREIGDKLEYIIYPWTDTKERLTVRFLGLSLPLFTKLIEAARDHPDTIDPLSDLIFEAMLKGEKRGIKPDSKEAEVVEQEVVKQIEQVLDELEATNAQPKDKP